MFGASAGFGCLFWAVSNTRLKDNTDEQEAISTIAIFVGFGLSTYLLGSAIRDASKIPLAGRVDSALKKAYFVKALLEEVEAV